MLACPKPPGIHPTSFSQNPKIRSVTPPRFMIFPAKIKKPNASKVKELEPATALERSILMLSPCTKEYIIELQIMQNATGIFMSKNPKNRINNNAIGYLPPFLLLAISRKIRNNRTETYAMAIKNPIGIKI